MKKFKKLSVSIFGVALIIACTSSNSAENSRPAEIKDSSRTHKFCWKQQYLIEQMLINKIAPPPGFERVSVEKGSFADWLRHLPLIDGRPDVKLYNGNLKGNQNAHYAILDIDVGNEDLQQCADAVMRLRAEYLYSKKKYENIHFKFTSGDNAKFSEWIKGYRPVISGNKVSWVLKAKPDNSYESFKSYMREVFMYAGTSSLSKEMTSITLKELKPGDVFIKGGFPGHAVIILDAAVNQMGQKVFMIAQSYMPAQQIHILKNPNDGDLSPWYSADFDDELNTPEWDFDVHQLKRFQN